MHWRPGIVSVQKKTEDLYKNKWQNENNYLKKNTVLGLIKDPIESSKTGIELNNNI